MNMNEATSPEAKKKFREMVKMYHPDSSDVKDEEKIKHLNRIKDKDEEILKFYDELKGIKKPEKKMAQDGTGPHGRKEGPGKGRKDGSGMKSSPMRDYADRSNLRGQKVNKKRNRRRSSGSYNYSGFSDALKNQKVRKRR